MNYGWLETYEEACRKFIPTIYGTIFNKNSLIRGILFGDNSEISVNEQLKQFFIDNDDRIVSEYPQDKNVHVVLYAVKIFYHDDVYPPHIRITADFLFYNDYTNNKDDFNFGTATYCFPIPFEGVISETYEEYLELQKLLEL